MIDTALLVDENRRRRLVVVCLRKLSALSVMLSVSVTVDVQVFEWYGPTKGVEKADTTSLVKDALQPLT